MFCALWLPYFLLQSTLRHRPALWKEAVAILDGEVVAEITPAAAREGVEPGQTPSQAMARCPGLHLLRRAPEQEQRLSHLLLEQATARSARVEATLPALCTLDLHAVPRLAFTPEALHQWATELQCQLLPHHLTARAGIATNPDLAFLAAQATSREEPVRVVWDTAAFLDPLPLQALHPPESLSIILSQWGIHTVGALRRLNRQSIASRLGAEGASLHDRACGTTRRLLRLSREAVLYEEAHDFGHELTTTEPLLFLLRRFVDQLTLRLSSSGLVVASMELTLTLPTHTDYQHAFQIPSPTAESDVLFRMLELHLESLRLEHPLTGARLKCTPTRPESSQFRLFESSLRDPNRFAETLARLTALAGSDRVGVPEPLATHEPDRFVLRMPEFTQFPPTAAEASPMIGLPLRRFRPPLPARVEKQGDRRALTYLEAGEVQGRVIALHGPYPLSGQWWEESWSMEEWDVELHTGRLCRLSRWRGREPEWSVEGVYA